MASGKTLGMIRRAESLARIPNETTVLPLDSRLHLPPSRVLADRPEALLMAEDEDAIQGAARQISANWSSSARLQERLRFDGLDVASCFSSELEMAARDFAKTAWIVRRCLERLPAERLVTDVPPLSGAVPAYPYFSALGTILEAEAKNRAIPFVNLGPGDLREASKRKTVLEKGYVALAARRGLRRLHSGRVLLAVGPFPDFYKPLAVAWRRGGSETVVLTRASAPMRPDSRLGLHLVTLESLQGAKDRGKIQEYVDTSLEDLSRLAGREDLVAAEIDLTPAFRMDLIARFQRDGSAIASVARGVRRSLPRVDRIVLAESWSPLSRAVLLEARKADIPITLLQHGVLAGSFSYGVAEADRIAAWGPSDALWFREHLGTKVGVSPTGSPRYDHLAQSNPKLARNNPAGFSSRGPVVLFASQPFVQDRPSRSPWDRAAIIETVLAVSRRLPQVHFIIKWHPAEQPENWIGAGVSQVHRANTFDLILRSDVLLSVSSTVALEAMYLDRPVIFLGGGDPESPFHPPEDGAGIRANGEEELLGRLQSLLADPALRERVVHGQREFLLRNYAPLDGQAASRVIALVREV